MQAQAEIDRVRADFDSAASSATAHLCRAEEAEELVAELRRELDAALARTDKAEKIAKAAAASSALATAAISAHGGGFFSSKPELQKQSSSLWGVRPPERTVSVSQEAVGVSQEVKTAVPISAARSAASTTSSTVQPQSPAKAGAASIHRVACNTHPHEDIPRWFGRQSETMACAKQRDRGRAGDHRLTDSNPSASRPSSAAPMASASESAPGRNLGSRPGSAPGGNFGNRLGRAPLERHSPHLQTARDNRQASDKLQTAAILQLHEDDPHERSCREYLHQCYHYLKDVEVPRVDAPPPSQVGISLHVSTIAI
eukprot:scaffold26275_cov31-Tisochrysis_lutea.AAC.6